MIPKNLKSIATERFSFSGLSCCPTQFSSHSFNPTAFSWSRLVLVSSSPAIGHFFSFYPAANPCVVLCSPC